MIVIKVPTLGEEPYEGEITDWNLEQIVSGLLIPSQALAKALAIELQKLRKEQPPA